MTYWRDTPQGALATRAMELSDNGDHARAIEVLSAAVRQYPEDALLLTHQSHVYRLLSESTEGEQAARRAIQLAPGLHSAWTELGLLMLDREDYAQAAKYLAKSAELCPDKSVFTILARAQLQFDAMAAAQSAKSALAMDESWEEAWVMLAEAIRKKGDE